MPNLNVRNKVLLFDFDGTIVATEGLAKQVIDSYFEQPRYSAQPGFSKQVPCAEMIVGRTWRSATENMVTLAQSYGYEIDSPDVLVREFKGRYRERFEKGVQLVPGVVELLPQLKAQSAYMAIVTGSERDEVESILQAHGLAPYFDRIWAFGDYEHSKPDPSPFATAMRDLGRSPLECLAFEDSKAGMESAFLAGLQWVQIAFEAHAVEPDSRSLMVIQDWNELQISEE